MAYSAGTNGSSIAPESSGFVVGCSVVFCSVVVDSVVVFSVVAFSVVVDGSSVFFPPDPDDD